MRGVSRLRELMRRSNKTPDGGGAAGDQSKGTAEKKLLQSQRSESTIRANAKQLTGQEVSQRVEAFRKMEVVTAVTVADRMKPGVVAETLQEMGLGDRRALDMLEKMETTRAVVRTLDLSKLETIPADQLAKVVEVVMERDIHAAAYMLGADKKKIDTPERAAEVIALMDDRKAASLVMSMKTDVAVEVHTNMDVVRSAEIGAMQSEIAVETKRTVGDRAKTYGIIVGTSYFNAGVNLLVAAHLSEGKFPMEAWLSAGLLNIAASQALRPTRIGKREITLKFPANAIVQTVISQGLLVGLDQLYYAIFY